jgi:hypothetical protein
MMTIGLWERKKNIVLFYFILFPPSSFLLFHFYVAVWNDLNWFVLYSILFLYPDPSLLSIIFAAVSINFWIGTIHLGNGKEVERNGAEMRMENKHTNIAS